MLGLLFEPLKVPTTAILPVYSERNWFETLPQPLRLRLPSRLQENVDVDTKQLQDVLFQAFVVDRNLSIGIQKKQIYAPNLDDKNDLLRSIISSVRRSKDKSDIPR